MDLLCVDQFATLGGAQRCLLDLIPAFLGRRWRVRVVLPEDGPLGPKLRAAGCKTESFRAGALSNRRKPFWQIPKYLAAHLRVSHVLARDVQARRPDLIYVNGPRFLPAASWVARQHHIPLLFHAHSRILQRPALIASQYALNATHAFVVSCCGYIAESLRLPAERLRVVYSGVPDLQPGSAIRNAAIRNVGVVGRIAPEKGQVEFARAARMIREIVPSTDFTIVGAPWGKSGEIYFRKVLNESCGTPLRFEGWRDEPLAFMPTLGLLAVPSECHDAAPRVILEAFSAGVPVVAFPSGGIPELIEDNRTGFLAKERSSTALASRILDVLRMPFSDVDRVVANARNAWRERFHIDRYRAAVCDAICSVARESSVEAIA